MADVGRPTKYSPESRFDVDNGITVCIECHAKIHPELRNVIINSQKN